MKYVGERWIPITLKDRVYDAQGDPRLLLHGSHERGLGIVAQERSDAPGEAGAEREDACMVIVCQGGQLVMAH